MFVNSRPARVIANVLIAVVPFALVLAGGLYVVGIPSASDASAPIAAPPPVSSPPDTSPLPPVAPSVVAPPPTVQPMAVARPYQEARGDVGMSAPPVAPVRPAPTSTSGTAQAQLEQAAGLTVQQANEVDRVCHTLNIMTMTQDTMNKCARATALLETLKSAYAQSVLDSVPSQQHVSH